MPKVDTQRSAPKLAIALRKAKEAWLRSARTIEHLGAEARRARRIFKITGELGSAARMDRSLEGETSSYLPMKSFAESVDALDVRQLDEFIDRQKRQLEEEIRDERGRDLCEQAMRARMREIEAEQRTSDRREVMGMQMKPTNHPEYREAVAAAARASDNMTMVLKHIGAIVASEKTLRERGDLASMAREGGTAVKKYEEAKMKILTMEGRWS